MSDQKDLDLKGALEQGTKKMSLQDLEQRGFKNVKVLDEKGLEELMRKAVDRVVNTQTAEEKARIVDESRKELDRLMKEHKAARSRAQLLEADKNELVEQVESLQRQLDLKADLEEELLHKKFQEGTASMQSQVEEVKKRAQAIDNERERLRVENASLDSQLTAEREKVAKARELAEKVSEEIGELQHDNVRLQGDLEASDRRLAEHDKSLQNEQSKVREAERARTELVEQVLQLQAKSGEAAKSGRELDTVRAEIARIEPLLREAAKENTALKGRATELETRLQEAQQNNTRATAEAARLEGENAPLRKEVQHLRSGIAAMEASLVEERQRSQTGVGETAQLRERLENNESKVRERQDALDQAQAEAARLEGENAPLRKEVQHLRSGIAAMETALVEERQKSQTGVGETAQLRERLGNNESKIRERQSALDQAQAALAALEAAMVAERAKSLAAASEAEELRKNLDELRDREAQLLKRVSDADHVEVERVHLQSELDRVRGDISGLEGQRVELEAARRALEDSRAEAGALRTDLERLEIEHEAKGVELEDTRRSLEDTKLQNLSMRSDLERLEKVEAAQREKTVIVTAELEDIEEQHQTEQQELEALRQVSKQLEDQLARTRADLEQAHGEMQSTQELLQREQDVARDARNETTTIHSRLQDLTGHAARLEEQLRGLSDDNSRLQQRLVAADTTVESAGSLNDRLAVLERLIELSRKNSGTARASIGESKAVTDLLRRTLSLARPRKKRKPALTLQGGVALDGHALLQEFFRRIRLKERLQKHVPVKEKDGQRHPSELLQDVVAALIQGDKRSGKDKTTKLEILGPTGGPDLADLRQFVGRVSPRASHAVSRVHEGLRNNLFSPPEKPARVVLDVGGVPLPRSYRPRIAYDPERREFVHGELRTIRDKDTQGIVPFLKESITKLPGAFPPSRVRFRLDSSYFSEDVVRFLNRKGCSYVMKAPTLAAIRDAAKKAKYRELSGGWEDGEFEMRIHPIRKTMGRFVVVRHRLSRRNGPEIKAQFRDQKFEYLVFVVDPKITPWRAYQAYLSRAASEAASASQLADFTKSKLLGKKRRQHGALFPLYMMASDLVQWFRRKAVPMDERERTLDSLRTDLLKLPTTQERMGSADLPVVPKRDASRKAFDRLTRNIRRLRPVRPFRFRK
jgi:predicted  nucleic acid-binding Zn-ribbon protein